MVETPERIGDSGDSRHQRRNAVAAGESGGRSRWIAARGEGVSRPWQENVERGSGRRKRWAKLVGNSGRRKVAAAYEGGTWRRRATVVNGSSGRR